MLLKGLIIFSGIFCLYTGELSAQVIKDTLRTGDTLDRTIDSDAEKLIENQTQDTEDSELLDLLNKLESNPLELNTSSAFDLQRIPYIDGIIASNIVRYRLSNGSYKSVAVLRRVNGVDEELYNKIRRYVYVSNSKNDFVIDESGKLSLYKPNTSFFRNFSFSLRNRFTNDLQPSIGFQKKDSNGVPVYQGSRPKIYNRLDIRYSKDLMKISAGLITEKDAGEKKLYDFIAGYVEYKNRGILNQFLVGDYTLEFGQGLTLWSSLSLGKGSEAVSSIKKKGDEINNYTSVNEVQFFRGAATKLHFDLPFGELNLFGFYSNNTLDVSQDTSLGQLSTIYIDGYHRTSSEINRQDSAKEKMFGGRIEYLARIPGTAKFGVTYYNSTYSKDFKSKDLYDFSGSKLNAVGFDFDYTIFNFNIFGEAVRNSNDAKGIVAGAKFVLLNTADFIFAYRNYGKDLVLLHSSGFGESDGTQNERGIYAGIKLKIPKLAVINAYFDQYKFPNRTFYNPVPTIGRDFLVYSEWKLSSNLNLIAKYKNEDKEDVTRIINEFGIDVSRIYVRGQRNYKLQLDYDISKTFRVKSRFEYIFVDYEGYKSSEKGILFFTDFKVKLLSNLSLDGRYAVFQTDSYDSRIYEYESELTGVVSNQGLYGKGRRWYFVLKYQPYSFLGISAKYSELFLDGVKSIGSGNDEVTGDFKNRFAIQLDVKF